MFDRQTRTTNPQQPFEVEAGARGANRIEPIKRIDKAHNGAAANRVRQRRCEHRGPPCRTGTEQFGDLAARPSAAQRVIDRGDPRREDVGRRRCCRIQDGVVEFARLENRLQPLNGQRSHVIRLIFATQAEV